MPRIAYFDCASGVSGDMCLGALLGAGFPELELRRQIEALGLTGADLKSERTRRAGLAAVKVNVTAPAGASHRHLLHIRALLQSPGLDPEIGRRSLGVFETLARAEAAVHGCSPEEIHFHEVGAEDAIIDIVGTVAGLRFLDVERVVCSPVTLGYGQVKAAHGLLPVPAPAVLELLRQGKGPVPVRGGVLEGEFATPTGVALMVALADSFGPLPDLCPEAAGYGAGAMDPPGRPNVLRLIIGAAGAGGVLPGGVLAGACAPERLIVIETEVDDTSPQFFGPLIERLLAAGALDASLAPVLMKKGRPGQMLRVLSRPGTEEALARIIFAETSTLGLRWREEMRWRLPRRVIEVRLGGSPGQAVAVKIGYDPLSGEPLTLSPEFEDCRRAAGVLGLPLRAVFDEARELARRFTPINQTSPSIPMDAKGK